MKLKIDLSPDWHKLLHRQCDRLIDAEHRVDVGELLNLVSQSYEQADKERRITERSMDVMSEEVQEANNELRAQSLEIKKSHERYALAAMAANDGIWDFDIKNDQLYLSSRWNAILGCKHGKLVQNFDHWKKRIHPWHRKLFQQVFDDHISGKSQKIEFEYKIKDISGKYIWVLTRGLASFDEEGKAARIAGSQTDITQRKKHEQELFKAAFYDNLTSLPNRALFMDRLQIVVNREKRLGETAAALLFIDLDRFKIINDSMGHEAGDKVLLHVAKILTSFIRPGDTVARLGGDEFTIILSEVENEDLALQIADRLLEEIKKPLKIFKRDVHVDASVGVAIIDHKTVSADDILRNADLAMYNAKTQGREKRQLFDTKQHAKMLLNLQIESELREALDHDQFVPYYQPIIDLKTGRIESFESLIRWIHPERGLIPPADFIPVAEEMGIIGDIGGFVLKQACKKLNYWAVTIKDKAKIPRIAVNVSVRQLTEESFFNKLCRILDRFTIDYSLLKLEVTESVIMSDPELILKRLEKLKAYGVKICIDDFGTGYSSLSYLSHFPFDVVKIDQFFIRKMSSDQKSHRLVQGIIGLAQDMNMEIVAEGVETFEELKELIAFECHFGQGYYFSKPVPSDIANALVSQDKVFDMKKSYTKQQANIGKIAS